MLPSLLPFKFISKSGEEIARTQSFIMGFSSTRASSSSTLSKFSSSSFTTSSTFTTTTGSIFPETFGIYSTKSSNDLIHATSSKEVSNPYFYISKHSVFRSKPGIILHHGPTKALTSIASAQIKDFDPTANMTLGSTRYGAAPTEALRSERIYDCEYHFLLFLSQSGIREYFE